MSSEKYIEGYEMVSKEMLQPIPGNAELALQWIIEAAIPIYTDKNLNPKSGKPDCNITRMEKEHFRTVMKIKLGAAKTEENRQKVIDHYKSIWSEGKE